MIKQLTNSQRDDLIEQYVEIVVDSLSLDDLIQIVSEDLTNFCDKLTDSELKEEIDNRDDELFDELVDNITSTDPVVYNTTSTDPVVYNTNKGKSFVDINNTGGKY